jgi:FixJ family two-component response regulator
VIFLTGFGDVDVTVRAMRQGAVEFLTKPVNDELLLEKVRNAIELSKRQRTEYNRRGALKARLDLLSPRETQVLKGVVDGLSNKHIARRLQISHKTVELHRHNMMVKMRANSIAEVVRMHIESTSMPADNVV